MPGLVYYNTKLSHSGLTGYKVFEGFNRKMKRSSLSNLLSYQSKIASENAELTDNTTERMMSLKQSRDCRKYCQKLAYYSATRIFTSKKSGKYKFKVAFLTLTAPDGATPKQILTAFDHFLDYLRRTANCVYVWKKELGSTNGHLHFHILINNFIPYYIVSWKWKRLLIAEGVNWPINEKGVHTDSHYRIEIPHSKSEVAAYIAKYLSKAFPLPKEMGYIWGKSSILDDCKEIHLIEGDYPTSEFQAAKANNYVIEGDYVTHICCDIRTLKDMCPYLHALFDEQYLEFCEKLTLPQKFFEC